MCSGTPAFAGQQNVAAVMQNNKGTTVLTNLTSPDTELPKQPETWQEIWERCAREQYELMKTRQAAQAEAESVTPDDSQGGKNSCAAPVASKPEGPPEPTQNEPSPGALYVHGPDEGAGTNQVRAPIPQAGKEGKGYVLSTPEKPEPPEPPQESPLPFSLKARMRFANSLGQEVFSPIVKGHITATEVVAENNMRPVDHMNRNQLWQRRIFDTPENYQRRNIELAEKLLSQTEEQRKLVKAFENLGKLPLFQGDSVPEEMILQEMEIIPRYITTAACTLLPVLANPLEFAGRTAGNYVHMSEVRPGSMYNENSLSRFETLLTAAAIAAIQHIPYKARDLPLFRPIINKMDESVTEVMDIIKESRELGLPPEMAFEYVQRKIKQRLLN